MATMLRAMLGSLALFVLVGGRVSAQDSLYAGDGPAWEFDDSNLVQHPAWTAGTVPKNIVILSFKRGTPPPRRAAIIARVHGVIVHRDTVTGFYMLRVATHPDACGVKQAIDFLNGLPEVSMAVPDLGFTTDTHDSIDPGGGLIDIPATHRGSTHPCPPGTGLLR